MTRSEMTHWTLEQKAPSGAFLLEGAMQQELFEEWRAVPGYEGYYEVSDWGRVRNARTYYIRKAHHDSKGYLRLNLCKDGVGKKHRVHRLVCSAFIGAIPKNMEVNHKDFDRANNHISNLEYVTHQENIRRSQQANRYHWDYTEADKHRDIIRERCIEFFQTLAKDFNAPLAAIIRVTRRMDLSSPINE